MRPKTPAYHTQLFRPVGRPELDLIAQSHFRAFPPRLPGQPIFYPVLNRRYALEIARDWNTRDPNAGHEGYVTRFVLPTAFLEPYPAQVVGASRHQELWIPAGDLAALNAALVGPIEVWDRLTADATELYCPRCETTLQIPRLPATVAVRLKTLKPIQAIPILSPYVAGDLRRAKALANHLPEREGQCRRCGKPVSADGLDTCGTCFSVSIGAFPLAAV